MDLADSIVLWAGQIEESDASGLWQTLKMDPGKGSGFDIQGARRRKK